MRSKITRWAAEAEYGKASARCVAEDIRTDEAQCGPLVRREIREWADA